MVLHKKMIWQFSMAPLLVNLLSKADIGFMMAILLLVLSAVFS